jgi:hypothetical protein
VPDRAVLAAGVHALQDDEHGPLPLGVEAPLAVVDHALETGDPPRGVVAVVDAGARSRVDRREIDGGSGHDDEPLPSAFRHASPPRPACFSPRVNRR